jgi:hypothetical protein
MQRVLALGLVAALTLPGCAVARATTSSRAGIAPAADPAIGNFVRTLAPGARVRIETAGGRSLRGTLLQATDTTVTIQRHTRVPEPPVEVSMQDIQRVTIDVPASSNRGMAIGAAIGAATAIAVLWLIATVAIDD